MIKVGCQRLENPQQFICALCLSWWSSCSPSFHPLMLFPDDAVFLPCVSQSVSIRKGHRVAHHRRRCGTLPMPPRAISWACDYGCTSSRPQRVVLMFEHTQSYPAMALPWALSLGSSHRRKWNVCRALLSKAIVVLKLRIYSNGECSQIPHHVD